MAPENNTSELKRLIIESLNLESFSVDMIGDEDPLFGSDLGLDSVDALELVVVMEKAYGIKIKSDEVGPEEFASVASLAAFLERKLESKRGLEGWDDFPGLMLLEHPIWTFVPYKDGMLVGGGFGTVDQYYPEFGLCETSFVGGDVGANRLLVVEGGVFVIGIQDLSTGEQVVYAGALREVLE